MSTGGSHRCEEEDRSSYQCWFLLSLLVFAIFALKSLIDKQKQTRQGKASGKLYCCFVDFKKAFDTVPRGLLWQVLERVGIRGPILDCIKSFVRS